MYLEEYGLVSIFERYERFVNLFLLINSNVVIRIFLIDFLQKKFYHHPWQQIAKKGAIYEQIYNSIHLTYGHH